MILITGVLLGGLLAFANGANDNFKGVATLYGCGAADYRRALAWATLTTAAGSIAAMILAGQLLASFSGKGLVPDDLAGTPHFALAVAFAASATVLLATRFGFPISTTHALVGGLIGAGLAADPRGVDLRSLGGAFVLPLLVSPGVSLFLATAIYPASNRARRWLGVERVSCLCVETVTPSSCLIQDGAPAASMSLAPVLPLIRAGTLESCAVRYEGRWLGISAQTVVEGVHYVSAGAVSFARGLNDTPKIAAILLTLGVLGEGSSLLSVGFIMALGGILFSRRVAETISHKVTELNPGQGLVANLITAGLVIAASPHGLPVSTTHVSLGAIFGIGAVTGRARWPMIGTILLAWLTTLPLAALLGALGFTGIAWIGG